MSVDTKVTRQVITFAAAERAKREGASDQARFPSGRDIERLAQRSAIRLNGSVWEVDPEVAQALGLPEFDDS